jgi:hypothetical protein
MGEHGGDRQYGGGDAPASWAHPVSFPTGAAADSGHSWCARGVLGIPIDPRRPAGADHDSCWCWWTCGAATGDPDPRGPAGTTSVVHGALAAFQLARLIHGGPSGIGYGPDIGGDVASVADVAHQDGGGLTAGVSRAPAGWRGAAQAGTQYTAS